MALPDWTAVRPLRCRPVLRAGPRQFFTIFKVLSVILWYTLSPLRTSDYWITRTCYTFAINSELFGVACSLSS